MKAVIATSIAPLDFEKQKTAISTWLANGFHVTSLNCPEEISTVQPHFPNVTFIPVERDARSLAGKPLVYFDDVLSYFNTSDCSVCGIVNSDIRLDEHAELIRFLELETKDSLVTGCRVDIQSEHSKDGVMYPLGLDYFFFDHSVIKAFPKDSFIIGAPWWDYWAAFVPVTQGVTVKQLIPPIGYHVEHPRKWNRELWYSFANRIYQYLFKNNIQLSFDQALIKSHGIHFALAYGVIQYIHDNAKTVSLISGHCIESVKEPSVDYNLLQRPPREAKTPDDLTRFNIMKTYLLKCIEKCPGFAAIVSTFNTMGILSEPQVTQVKDIQGNKVAPMNTSRQFIRTLSENPSLDALSDACVNSVRLISQNVPYDNAGFIRAENTIKSLDEKTFSILAESCTRGTEDGFLHYWYGLALEGKGLFEKALSEYQAALSYGLNAGRLRYLMGKLALKEDKVITALGHFSALRSMYPQSREIASTLQQLLLETNRYRADVILRPLVIPEQLCYPDHTVHKENLPKISVVLPTKSRDYGLEDMLKSLPLAMHDVPYEILLYIGGELTDDLKRLIDEHRIERIFYDKDIFGPTEKFSWAKIMNHGFNHATGQWVMYASDDIVLHPYAFKNAVLMIDGDDKLGGITFLHRNTVEDFGGKYRDFGYDSFNNKIFINFGIINKQAYAKTTGFNERLQFYWADVDMCMQLWEAGFKIKASLFSLIDHNNVSDKRRSDNSGDTYHADTKEYFQKWRGNKLFTNRNILARERYSLRNTSTQKILDLLYSQITQESPNDVRHSLLVKKSFGQKLPMGVNVAGYFNGEFGIAEAARDSVFALQTTSIPFVLNNIVQPGHRHEDLTFKEFSHDNPYYVNLIHVNADQAKVFREIRGEPFFRDRYNIGVWFWELENFPAKYFSSFQYYNEIWAKSEFCRQAFAKVSPVPVVRIKNPVIMDEKAIQPDRAKFSLSDEEYVFLFLFDYLSIFERKNPLGTIAAFQKAFSREDKTRLLIKSINSHCAPEKVALLHSAASGSNISFIDMHLDPRDLFSLMASGDCFVSLHRSEGFGLGLAQSMYLGKPAIATGYSGNMDYMTADNSFLVNYKLVELEKDYGPYEKGNVWAEPDVDHAAELMRLVYNDRALAERKAQQAEKDIKNELSPQAIGVEMQARIKQIYEGEAVSFQKPAEVSIIILTHNELEYTKACLESVKRNTPEPHEVIIVDNGSTDSTLEYLKAGMRNNENMKVISNRTNRGFAAGNNQGIAIAQGDYVLLLNNDTVVTEGWLGPMLDVFKRHPETGVVGPMSNYVSGPQLVPQVDYKKNEAIDSFAERWREEHSGQSFPIYRVVGFCLLTKREVIDRIGGLDEQFGSGNFEDDDFCNRAALAGYEARVARDVYVHHTGSQTFKGAGIDYKKSLLRNWELFKAKWGIPADTPYEKGYNVPLQPQTGLNVYIPLPDVSIDHRAADSNNRWLKDVSLKEMRRQRTTGLTSVIVLTSDQFAHTKQCIKSLRKNTPERHEIIIVDNGFSPKTTSWLRNQANEDRLVKLITRNSPGEKQKEIEISEEKKEKETAARYDEVALSGGYAKACNQGINQSSGEYIAILTDDVVVSKGWLSGMLECLEVSDTGIVGPMTTNVEGPQNVIKTNFGSVENLDRFAGAFREKNRYRRVPSNSLAGCCMLFRHEFMEKIGLFDEHFDSDEFAIDDFYFRAMLEGYRNIVAADVFIHHYAGMSSPGKKGNAAALSRRKRDLFIQKWSKTDDETALKLSIVHALQTANEMSQKGMLDSAIGALMVAIKLNTDEKRLYYTLAEILMENMKFAEAQGILQNFPERIKQETRWFELSAKCSAAMQSYREAEEYADKVLAMNNASPAALNIKGLIALNKGLNAEAEKFFEKALKADRGFAEAYANIGRIKWPSNQEAAFALFEKAFILAPVLSDVAMHYYNAVVSLSRFERAEAIFRDAAALYPMNKRMRFFLKDMLLRTGRYREAEEANI